MLKTQSINLDELESIQAYPRQEYQFNTEDLVIVQCGICAHLLIGQVEQDRGICSPCVGNMERGGL